MFPKHGAENGVSLGLQTVADIHDYYDTPVVFEEGTLTAIGYDASMFDIVDGASIRTEAPYGIRFTANVNKTLYEQLVAADANVEFGIVLGAKRYIYGEDFFTDLDNYPYPENYAKMVYTGDQLKDQTVAGTDVKQFRAAIYIKGDENLANAGKTQFETQMTANAYFTIHMADGSTQTIWADYDADNNTRSLYDVAKAYVELVGKDNAGETINHIISVCEAAQ